MSLITAAAYTPADSEAWDSFVAGARNGLFQFARPYMDYHADRFVDGSIIVREEGAIVAVLPASRDGDVLVSHGGLTFGGLVLGRPAASLRTQAILEAVVGHAASAGVKSILYKAMPRIFQAVPSDEDLYFLHQLGARLVRRDLSTAVSPFESPKLRKGRRYMLSRARKIEDLQVEEGGDWEAFWALLTHRLDEAHGVRPVHSLDEIRLLQQRFPDNISLVTARTAAGVHAGIVLFRFGAVDHTQYMATDAFSRENGLLDTLVQQSIATAAEAGRWLSFGISTADGGRVVNPGLLDYKESFGGRSVAHDHYELALT